MRATPSSVPTPCATQAARRAACACALLVLASGCSSLSVDSAKNLASCGQDAATQGVGNTFVSGEEFQRALDAEAFFHGCAGTPVPAHLIADYQAVQRELSARKTVFSLLGETYEAFYALADSGSEANVETAVSRLGDAVNGYAAALNKNLTLSNADKDALARLGGVVVSEVQKRKLEASSARVRKRLEALAHVMRDPLVRAQLTSFKKALTASRSCAIKMLWDKGLLDPSPLISELGRDAGLKAGKDAVKILSDPKSSFVKEGLGAVVASRMERRLDLIEKSYDASVKTVEELIAQHRKLEGGGAFSLEQLRQLMTELQLATDSLSTSNSGEDD